MQGGGDACRVRGTTRPGGDGRERRGRRAKPELMRRLALAIAPVRGGDQRRLGLSADYKEAIAFALLASARVDGDPGNVPEVTGARRPVLLGKLTEC